MTFTLPRPGQILKWLGGPVDVRVELDTGLIDAPIELWDTAEWDTGNWSSDDPAWADITPYIFSVTITAGAQRWGERFDSASADITVDNTTGVFTPESGIVEWLLPFRPGRRIRVVAVPDEETGVKVPLFTGQIDQTLDQYDDAGHAITTGIVCTDYMAAWSAHTPVPASSPTGYQLSSVRVNAALDRYGWPVDQREIQTGNHDMQSSFLDQSTLEECQLAADAEGGAFYCDRTGKAVFKARDWLTTDSRSVNIQGYLGYDEIPAPPGASVWDTALWDTDIWAGYQGNSAHIIGVAATWEQARIVNQVKMARTGGPIQTEEDPDSQSAYGIRTYQVTDLPNRRTTDVAILANRYLAAFKDSRMRIDSVTISAVDDMDNTDKHRLFWDTRFGDRLALRIATPWGWDFDKEVHVMALHHQISSDDWTVTLQLDDAQTFEGG